MQLLLKFIFGTEPPQLAPVSTASGPRLDADTIQNMSEVCISPTPDSCTVYIEIDYVL